MATYRNYRDMTRCGILSIIQNPLPDILSKQCEKFNTVCSFNNLSSISVDDMKWALVTYLEECYESDPRHMDVKMVCKSNWENTAFLDTAPRDRILTMLEQAGKIRKL